MKRQFIRLALALTGAGVLALVLTSPSWAAGFGSTGGQVATGITTTSCDHYGKCPTTPPTYPTSMPPTTMPPTTMPPTTMPPTPPTSAPTSAPTTTTSHPAILPVTGSNSALLVVVGSVLLLAGSVMVAARRRRKAKD